jgi:hypothetical protein
MKQGIFVGPQITQVFEDYFSIKLNVTERTAWEANENACRNFQANQKV